MKALITLTAVLFYFTAVAQVEITKSCISTGGGTATTGNTDIVSGLGEVAVNEATQGTVHISEGFINPGTMATAGVENYARGGFMLHVFPNPATDYIRIQFDDACTYQILLFDLQGHEWNRISGAGKESTLTITTLPPGEYMLLVKNLTDKKYRAFKIIISD